LAWASFRNLRKNRTAGCKRGRVCANGYSQPITCFLKAIVDSETQSNDACGFEATTPAGSPEFT
jgi:hypothetical protein